MKIISALWISLLLSSVSLFAQVDLISAESFKTYIKENPDVVILDANKSKNYKTAHITDAIYINHNDLYQEGEIKGLIKSPKELAVIFGELGVDTNTPVVVTDGGSQKYSSRVYWILQYLGHENVKILHKDKNQWRDARIELTSTPGKAEAKVFEVKLCPEYIATLQEVELTVNDPLRVLVDVRTEEEYTGNHKNSTGHLPQAIHFNYEDLLTETGAFKPKEELQKLATDLNLTAEKEIIFYCRTSIRATVSFVAFKNILGYENVKVYDGAYLEWISTNEVVQ